MNVNPFYEQRDVDMDRVQNIMKLFEDKLGKKSEGL